HWEPHAVVNRADIPRIHLVIDRDIHVDRPALPFETFPIPADMADLIERSQQ
ncbi:aspartyl beta-hydroxylase, partial [Mycobacteroides abscessus]